MGDRNYKISADAPVEEYMRYFGIPRNQAIELRAQRILMMERSKQLLPKNYGSNEENPETVDSERGRANGGRIGFQDGKTLDFEVYKFYFMNALGMDEEEAEKATEQELYGPDSARLRDSKKGIGSMMASADDDIKDPSDMLTDDAMDMFKTDETELLMELLKSGQMAKLDDDELRRMYDSMVESEAGIRLLDEFNINSFEDYKSLIESTKRPEGIMQTMVA